MNATIREVLVRNGYIDLKESYGFSCISMQETRPLVGTLIANMTYYGYIPSTEVLDLLNGMAPYELKEFWKAYEPVFKNVTGANRNMEKFVVYKNFPQEVLNMSEAQYWYNQILMYLGLPKDWFSQEEDTRPAMLETLELKVLHLSDDSTLDILTQALIDTPARWTDNQNIAAVALYDAAKFFISVDAFAFKENGINLVKHAINNHRTNNYSMSNATDILRLCAALSEQDVSLRTPVRFRNFPRHIRKNILYRLNSCKNLKDDFCARPEVWKRLLQRLHPGDYRECNNVIDAYSALYNDSHLTFNKIVDGATSTKYAVLNALKARPGEFLRRFHATYNKYGQDAVDAFCQVIPKLSNMQIIKLHAYLRTVNDRQTFIIPPKGSWKHAKILDNKKAKIIRKHHIAIAKHVRLTLKQRMADVFPQGVSLDARLKNVKLQTNDQKLAEYGRGTTFDIPENIKFIRSASYWQQLSRHTTWFDNGWNFFNSDWKSVGVCSWDSNHGTRGAIFSGDPVNSKELKGRACQMIDLDLDKLAKSGVRYAVWNILAYSRLKFSDATDVLATLQMGEDAIAGKLYEPARAQMVFPLKQPALTSYVAYIDVQERKLVYMDADFGGDVSSARRNSDILSRIMPAYLEYLDSLPSVHDVFAYAKRGNVPVLYSDEDVEIQGGSAYVFKTLNPDNSYDKLNISDIL